MNAVKGYRSVKPFRVKVAHTCLKDFQESKVHSEFFGFFFFFMLPVSYSNGCLRNMESCYNPYDFLSAPENHVCAQRKNSGENPGGGRAGKWRLWRR